MPSDRSLKSSKQSRRRSRATGTCSRGSEASAPGTTRPRRVELVRFETPAENVLHVTWEWKLKPPARKGNRADVMFVVNGIPVAIVEHKNPKDGDAIERAIKQLRRYELETPELIGGSQLFNVTHLIEYWYGVT